MSSSSVYFFNSDAALDARNSSQDADTLFFYDGVALEDAPSNCINVPIGTFYDFFLKTTHPQVSQINFDNVDFSDDIKSQITQSITETITAIKNNKIEIINALLPAEISEQNVDVMIFSFLKHLLDGADEKATAELIIKLLKITLYLQTHNYQNSPEIQSLQTQLSDSLQTKEMSMSSIMLSFILKQLRDKTEFDKNRRECLEEIDKYDVVHDILMNSHYLAHIYQASEFKTYVKEYADILFKGDFFDLEILQQKVKIYKFFFATNQGFKFFEDFKEMYYVLKPLYLKAMELDQDELVMSLYYPLQFSWNGVVQTQEEHKTFNDEVELALESYVKNTLIDKYKLKPNNRKIKPNQKKIKVAILIHRVLNLSVNNIMVSLLEAIKANPDKQYEFIIYDLNLMEMLGSDRRKVEELKELGFKYVDLHYRFYDNGYAFYSIIDKTLKTRELLIKDKIDILIGYHNRAEYNFLFTSRTAPKQIYWSHGNHEYDLDNLDKKITHCGLENRTDFDWFGIPMKENIYSPAVDMSKVRDVREKYPKNSFILGTIGRLIKIDDDEYLQAVASIMKENPQTIYLACGGGEKEPIQKKVKHLGIADRFFFVGHIDAHIYNYVIDLWLEPFNLSNGESLNEYMHKNRPYITLWNEWSEEDKLKESYSYDKYVWPYSVENYIDVANKLINDKELVEFVLEKRKPINEKILNSVDRTFLDAISD